MKVSSFLQIVTAMVLGTTIVGCATTSEVDVVPNVTHASFHTVYLVVHGGNSGDVDDDIRRALLQHGLSETEGSSDTIQGKDVDLVVKYDDHWRWDITMYLKTIDIQFFDGKTGTLIAESSWQNSTLHGFHGADKVVDDLVDKTFAKLSADTK